MCLIAFAFSPDHPNHLLLVANRDEFHARPARPMAWHSWPNGWLGGRDEQAGGTWLAAARDGRWAALTNLRQAPAAESFRRSRGELPLRFLEDRASPESFARALRQCRNDFAPFNLLVGDRVSLWHVSSRVGPVAVRPGVHALSNGCLDEAWPKSRRAATALRGLLGNGGRVDPERLLALMDDRSPAPDRELPDTGVGLEAERFLSPPFILDERYGTRCTSLLSLGAESLAVERSFDARGRPAGQLEYRFAGC